MQLGLHDQRRLWTFRHGVLSGDFEVLGFLVEDLLENLASGGDVAGGHGDLEAKARLELDRQRVRWSHWSLPRATSL